jgi:3-hydroxybutyryl-CoA dehydrogenase
MAAQSGATVWLLDAQPGAAAAARDALAQTWSQLVSRGKLTENDANAFAARLRVAASMAEMAACDLFVEAIVERLDAKQKLMAALEAIAKPDAVIVSNTSSLSITTIATALQRPERCAGYHFFNPVPLMKVVEVVAGLRTAPQVLDRLDAFTRSFGHTPVRAQDTPGFIVNHAGRGYGTEALKIVGESVSDFATIDAILKDQAGFRLGPFELMDLTALDVSHPVMESIYHQYFEEARYRPSVITAQRLAGGLLGRKTGEGFYRYTEGKAVTSAAAPPPKPEALPSVWLPAAMPRRDEAKAALAACGAALEMSDQPSPGALIFVAPLGEDVSAAVARLPQAYAPRCVGWDLLLPDASVKRRVIATHPGTTAAYRDAAHALLGGDGKAVSVIRDSCGFVTQRVLATIINIASDICQQGICTPGDLDLAVTLGLGYPKGPLAWGDAIGTRALMDVLDGIHRTTGDPRYRASPWLRRRAQLGMSLLEPGA